MIKIELHFQLELNCCSDCSIIVVFKDSLVDVLLDSECYWRSRFDGAKFLWCNNLPDLFK